MNMTKYKAVLIDDEFWTREVLRSLGHWEQLNIEIVGEASDGIFGVEIIKQLKPDIVITDVKMPGMNGLDMAEYLSKNGLDCSIIVVSGYDDFDLVHRALKIGVFDYLLKPIKEEELNRQLEACVKSIQSGGRKKNVQQLSVNTPTEPWAQNFSQLLPSLKESVETGNTSGVEEGFSKLSALLKGHDSIATQIYVYSVLNERLLSTGAILTEEKGLVSDRLNARYVFGEETTTENMIAFCRTNYLKSAEAVDQQIHGGQRFNFASVKRYVDIHYLDRKLSLESLAKLFSINKEYLSRGWKNEFGTLFSDYLLSLKMAKAREMLRTNFLSIVQVGNAVGYDDLANFYRAFKKYFGINPGEIRNNTKNDNEVGQEKPKR